MTTTAFAHARRLYADARDAKREEARARRRARERMEELRRFCEYYGIALEAVRTEGTAHGPRSISATD